MQPASRPTARIRSTPQDFQVDEISAYEPSGEGEHLYVTFRKTSLDTLEAVRRLARALSVSPRDAGTAGLKDRHAVTVQTASFPFALGRPLPEPASLSADGLEVLAAARHGNKLRTGHLRGNRFRLVLRGLEPARVPAVIAELAALGERGLPNAFGSQRFGRGGDNARSAEAWMSGKRPPPRDLRVRRLEFSALQSELFQRVLERRVEQGTWDTVLGGDLVVRGASSRPSLSTDPAADAQLARAGEASATGPMVGAKMPWPEGVPLEIERAALATWGVEASLFDRWKVLGEGARRPLRLVPTEIKAAALADEPGSMHVEFVLPKGAYATSVLAAVCVVEDAARTEAAGRSSPDDPPGVLPTGKEESEE